MQALKRRDVVNERSGIIVGSGGPSTRAIVEAAETTIKSGGPKKIGPFEVPKAMCSGPSAALATAFQIKGTNYSISSACATSAHCIGNAAELIQWGKQDVMFAGGCEELDWTLSNLFDAMGAMSIEASTPRHRKPAAPTTRTATASSLQAAQACWFLKSSNTPKRAARKFTAKSLATARRQTATTWSRRRAKVRRAA